MTSGPRQRVAEAVERSRAAQQIWGARSFAERLPTLIRYRRLLGSRREEIVESIRVDTRKPRVEAMAEIFAAVELFRFYETAAPRALRTEQVSTGWIVGTRAHVVREPWGVVGVITPWNYPFLLAQDAVTAAVVAGNGVVLKPSEVTPAAAHCIDELMTEAGFPDGLLTLVEGEGDVGAALVESGVDRVCFTGSTETGRKVMASAAKAPKPVTLELGGKDPAIVLEDADLERAARGIVWGAFFNAGQTCLSTERVLVHSSVHDRFVEKVVRHARELKVGPAESDLGPMVTEDQGSKVRDQLRDAVATGAHLELGELPERQAPCEIHPVVLTSVPDQAKVWQEETFGPLLPIRTFETDDEAIRMANDTRYGLYGSVWTEDAARGERLAGRLRLGGVSINDTLSHYSVAALPMGGVGASGFGVRRGIEGLREMTRPRSVFVQNLRPSRSVWWYPYDATSERGLEAILVLRTRGWIRGLPEAIRILRGAR